MVGLALTFTWSCRRDDDPEVVVRRRVEAALEAARDSDPKGALRDVADDFVGPDGVDRHETRRIVTGYLLRPGWKTVFAPRVDVSAPSADGVVTATMDLVLARGRPVERLEDVLPQQAERIRLEVDAELRDGDWRFTRARRIRGLLR